jgi:hypothetical protein
MHRPRFRIRTILMIVAMLAAAMGAWRSAPPDAKLVFFLSTASVVFIVAIAFGGALIVEFFVFGVRLCFERTRRPRISRKVDSPVQRPNPDRSGGPEGA